MTAHPPQWKWPSLRESLLFIFDTEQRASVTFIDVAYGEKKSKRTLVELNLQSDKRTQKQHASFDVCVEALVVGE